MKNRPVRIEMGRGGAKVVERPLKNECCFP